MSIFSTFGQAGGRAAALAATAALLVPGAALVAQSLPQQRLSEPPALTAEESALLTKQLESALRSEIARFAPTAPVEDIEAALIFVVVQSQYTELMINTVFDKLVVDPKISDNAKQAIENIRKRLKQLKRGTGALAGGDGFSTPTPPVGPVVDPGSGKSNYNNQ